jgi:uncharacterized protein YciI
MKYKNMFVVTLDYIASLSEIDAFRPAHLAFLTHGYDSGLFIASGPQVPRNGGIILAICSTKEVLWKTLEKDPFMLNNLATYKIIEFEPTRHNSVFEKFL